MLATGDWISNGLVSNLYKPSMAWQKGLADGKVMNEWPNQSDLFFRELICEADFAEAELGQLSHELAPGLLLGHQGWVESLELLLFTNEPQPSR